MEAPRLPDDKQRLAIVGRTGTGKTVAALWHLSKRNLERPWVIYDFKGDEHIAKIENARSVGLDWVPRRTDRGIFVVRPSPADTEAVDEQMWNLWERERCGVFVDEGYLANNEALQAILTQGRSKRIPAIICTQRPAWVSRFVFSESDYYQVFALNDVRDRKTIAAFAPIDPDGKRLPDFYSYYYDVGRDKLHTFKPVPKVEEIIAAIDAKLRPARKVI
jgi:hypothetical protein